MIADKERTEQEWETKLEHTLAALRAAEPVRRDPWCVEECPGTTFIDDQAVRCPCYWRYTRRQKWAASGGPARLFEARFDTVAADLRFARLAGTFSNSIMAGVPMRLIGAARTRLIASVVVIGGERQTEKQRGRQN